jgi:hypothetical protein
MAAYVTLSEAVDDLQRRGYVDDLQVAGHCLTCGEHSLAPADFHIDEFHRFEGDTDPADESIVYAISAPTLGVKGVLVNAFGAQASGLSQELVAKLATH